MSVKNFRDSIFTQKVKNILSRLYQKSALGDTLLDGAIRFFEPEVDDEPIKSKVKQTKDHLTEQVSKTETDNNIIVEKTTRRDKNNQAENQVNRTYSDLLNVCYEILALSEGDSFDESNYKTSKLLGTIQLLGTSEPYKAQQYNERAKPLYKALICLRLFDRLYLDNQIDDSYISNVLESGESDAYLTLSTEAPDRYERIVDEIKIPILIAALLQDVGIFHPDARKMLRNDDDLEDITKILSIEERKKFIQINFKATNDYLLTGLGLPDFMGNSREERTLFQEKEFNKQQFIKRVIRSAIKPTDTIGNLFKVCQIYASFVLSTKGSYQYKLLPKVFHMLNRNAEEGHCSQSVVDALRAIMGDFPPGYGVTYIPEDNGSLLEYYEYAIVNRLYPKNPDHPHCRTATRNLQFVGYGHDMIISQNSNLWFQQTSQAFRKISEKRLHEILELLASNYDERRELDLIPRSWYPDDYFSQREFQNLWTKREVVIFNNATQEKTEYSSPENIFN